MLPYIPAAFSTHTFFPPLIDCSKFIATGDLFETNPPQTDFTSCHFDTSYSDCSDSGLCVPCT